MYSEGFKINVNKLSAEEALLVLVRIEHPFVSEPICLVNDSADFTLDGERFIAMPFRVRRQDDIEGELPRASLVFPNAGRSLVKWIDMSGGGRGASLEVMLARRSNPLPEEKLFFEIGSVSVTTETISFNLIVQNNLTKRAIRWVYDMTHSRGLF